VGGEDELWWIGWGVGGGFGASMKAADGGLGGWLELLWLVWLVWRVVNSRRGNPLTEKEVNRNALT